MHFVQHRSPFARIALGFLALALTLATPAVQAAGVVGTGTAASCTEAALDTALAGLPAGRELYVLPTYTAMLGLREILAGRGAVREFWRDA